MQYNQRVLLKHALGQVVTWAGWPGVQRRLARAKVLVLTYHGVTRGTEDGYVFRQSVEARTFDAQLTWLSRHYRFLRLSSLVDALHGRKPFPEGGVVVTFDDGLRNVRESALPVLLKHEAPATVFVCSGWVGRGPLWTDEVNVLVMGAPRETLASPFDDGRQFPLRGLAARERAAHAVRVRMKRLDPSARAEALTRLRQACLGGGRAVDIDPECHDLLSWDDIRVLSRAGIEIGSHGSTHTVDRKSVV